MTANKNPNIALNAKRVFDLKTDAFSDEITGLIATVDVLDVPDVIKANSLANETSTTVYTTPAEGFFYLCAYTLSGCVETTNTSSSVRLNAVVGGNTVAIAAISVLQVGTAGIGGSMAQSLHRPLRIDPNTAITLTTEDATASVRGFATIQGFQRAT